MYIYCIIAQFYICSKVKSQKKKLQKICSIFSIFVAAGWLPGKKVLALKLQRKRETQIDISSLGNTTYFGNLQETERETDILWQKKLHTDAS